MQDLIKANSSSDTKFDSPEGHEDSPVDDCSSDDGSWEEVKKKAKPRNKKTPKLKKLSSTALRRSFNHKSIRNQIKVKPGIVHAPEKAAYVVKEDEDWEESPECSFPEKCTYCKVSDANCIVQCGNCKKWFCNSTTKYGSHIIGHLARAGHNEVILHKNAFPENAVLKLGCFHCHSANVFDLGFVTNVPDSYHVLLCRLPCGVRQKSGLNGADLRQCDWQPIISDRYLLTWLAEKKSSQMDLQKTYVSRHRMDKLENLWKDDPYAAFDYMKLERCNTVQPESIMLRYENAEQFERIFKTLVRLEEDIDEMQNKMQLQDNTTVRWEKQHSRGFPAFVAYFIIENPPAEINLSINKELRLRFLGNNPEELWSRVGHIVKTPKHTKDEIGVQFRIDKKMTECTNNFIVENVYNSSSYTRMYNAMEEFSSNKESMSIYIHKCLLGKNVGSSKLDVCVPNKLSVKGLPKLNQSQEYAIKWALQHPLCLIQGPPGTGKTVTSASLVYQLVQQGNGTVLVCAPSNTAVDNLTVKLDSTGLNIVRVFAKSREDTESPVLFLGLHVLICKMEGWNDIPELVKLHRERQLIGELSPVDEKRYNYLKWPFEQKLLSAADVICCTCVTAGDGRMTGFEFHSILIDECTQATEPECMIPLVRGAQQVIFVGDHCQLGPVIKSYPAKNAGLGTSLFERLLVLENHLVKLQVQYRMHPDLSRFSSNLFYDNELKDGVIGVNHKIQNLKLESLWPKPETPMLFYGYTKGQDELAATGTSFLNQTEAVLVEKFIAHLLGCGLTPNQIGIITPYQGQRGFLAQYLDFCITPNHSLYQQIEVASVDAFQGREKDLIIFSCVRSNDRNNIGFLNDARRLNVAITRARYGLIVIGNPKVLTKDPLWNLLLIHFDSHNALVEGFIKTLKKSNVKLNKPSTRKTFMECKAFSAKEYFCD